MKVNFHEGYLLIVAACGIFCLLSLLYSVVNRTTEGYRQRRLERKTAGIASMLKAYEQGSDREQARIKKKLYWILLQSSGMLALLKALDILNFKDSGDMNPSIRQLLCSMSGDLYRHRYRYADPMVQGVVIEICVRCDLSSSMLKNHLLRQLKSTDMVLRTECFRCIAAQQDRKLLLKALRLVSQENMAFSSRMLTDVLMEYTGDLSALMDLLLGSIRDFSWEVQVSLLRALTNLQRDGYGKPVLAFLQDGTTDKEARLSAMKYFEKVSFPEAVPCLLDFLSSETWEYAAVASRVLKSYDCSRFYERLKPFLASTNWYVRNNCAQGIVMHCTKEQIQDALSVEDRYGRDSMHYALLEIERSVV